MKKALSAVKKGRSKGTKSLSGVDAKTNREGQQLRGKIYL